MPVFSPKIRFFPFTSVLAADNPNFGQENIACITIDSVRDLLNDDYEMWIFEKKDGFVTE